jgi:recombination DNA repair RAD52 pathway protein
MSTNNELALVHISDLSLVDENVLSAKQLKQLLKRTPKQYVHTRPAKGGGTWDYVTGGYVRKVLNIMFGWNWSFEILDNQILHGEVIVKGKLTCTSGGTTIVKMQYGNKDVICKKGTDIPISIGNDLKAAATDALKKCAAELGIAADIYNKMDFKEVAVDTTEVTLHEIKELYELKKDGLDSADIASAERIILNEEKNSYYKLFKKLQTA